MARSFFRLGYPGFFLNLPPYMPAVPISCPPRPLLPSLKSLSLFSSLAAISEKRDSVSAKSRANPIRVGSFVAPEIAHSSPRRRVSFSSQTVPFSLAHVSLFVLQSARSCTFLFSASVTLLRDFRARTDLASIP